MSPHLREVERCWTPVTYISQKPSENQSSLCTFVTACVNALPLKLVILPPSAIPQQATICRPLRLNMFFSQVLLITVVSKRLAHSNEKKSHVNHKCNFLMFVLTASFCWLTEWQLVNDMNREQQNRVWTIFALCQYCWQDQTAAFFCVVRQADSSICFYCSSVGSHKEYCTIFFITPIHAVWKDSGIDLEWIKRKQEAEKGLQYLTS